MLSISIKNVIDVTYCNWFEILKSLFFFSEYLIFLNGKIWGMIEVSAVALCLHPANIHSDLPSIQTFGFL